MLLFDKSLPNRSSILNHTSFLIAPFVSKLLHHSQKCFPPFYYLPKSWSTNISRLPWSIHVHHLFVFLGKGAVETADSPWRAQIQDKLLASLRAQRTKEYFVRSVEKWLLLKNYRCETMCTKKALLRSLSCSLSNARMLGLSFHHSDKT